MRKLHYGDVKPGDIVIVNVPCSVRVNSIDASQIASGMRAYRGEVIDVPNRYTFDCGTLVDVCVYDERGEASKALTETRGVA